ncbi:FISUMP domain-containing protein [Fibrobacter sp. UBA2449]|uniref:FISUMP domain-containing protein n=1 Tax=Fibrobacter sp. UBA2449 TaxID=1946529 RepID=UPI0025B86B4E|nr:FISUMP domain-containing protein [Fibrobacter sp. UBA2449]
MSVASEITRLNGAKADIIQAITDKGVTVPSSAKLDDMALLIASITGGGGSVGGITTKMIDSEVGIKIVDENGYIGASITNYFPHAGNTYYNNFAIVLEGVDFSQEGLGQVRFITPGTSDIGGRTYRTVNIGGVTWLAENLDFKFSGVNIGPSGSPSSPSAWYYNNDEATYGIDGTRKCGLLYNWHAVKHLNDNRSTLCPGWHVPTTSEWDALATAVGGTSTAGTKLKASGVSWASSWGGTDDYGFAAFPAGHRDSGSFIDLGSYANFWTATGYSSSNAANRDFSTGASMNSNSNSKSNGYSVRLVKDS